MTQAICQVAVRGVDIFFVEVAQRLLIGCDTVWMADAVSCDSKVSTSLVHLDGASAAA